MLPVFLYERGIATNILGIALAIELLVLSPGSIRLLLLLVNAAKIIWVLRSPLLIELAFLTSATFCPAASLLAFLEARVGNE